MDLFDNFDDPFLFGEDEFDLDGTYFEPRSPEIGFNASKFDLLSTSPSGTDSGIDVASFESNFDPDATLTNGSTDDEKQNIALYFNKIYESFVSFDGSECDGPDSPKRLYNRKPSAHFAKTEEELSKEILVKTSKLSSEAAEFIPSKKAVLAPKTDNPSWAPLEAILLEFQKLLAASATPVPYQVPTSPLPQPRQANYVTSTPVKNRNRANMACVFCHGSGFDKTVVMSHCLRNPVTKDIICPNLVGKVCVKCGPTDEDWLLHTTEQCRIMVNPSSDNVVVHFRQRN